MFIKRLSYEIVKYTFFFVYLPFHLSFTTIKTYRQPFHMDTTVVEVAVKRHYDVIILTHNDPSRRVEPYSLPLSYRLERSQANGTGNPWS